MSISVEEIGEERLPEISNIFFECLQMQYKEVLPDSIRVTFTPEKSVQLWQNSFTNMADMKLVGAFIDGNLTGFAKFGSYNSDPTLGYLASLYVSPRYARRGIGKNLLEYVLKEMDHYKSVYLWVFKKNASAINLYTSQGFIHSGEERVEPEWEIPQSLMQLNNS